MRLNSRQTSLPRAASQRGQAYLIIIVFMTGFMLAVMGLATDYTEIWAHRQMAQNAADAACQAGSADIFLNAVKPSIAGNGGIGSFSWIGTDFDCTSTSTAPPCVYAALNGYSSNVHVSFPTAVAGVAPLTGAFATAFPYIKVTVTDPISMYFSKVASSTQNMNVVASATCGLTAVSTPVPLVILHPTAVGALTASGTSLITVIGGPTRSIQVDSDNTQAITVGSSGTNIDLHQGGPAGTGSDVGVFGGPTTKPTSINVGSTGHYLSPANPFGDPYATVTTPAVPTGNGSARAVPFAVNGCPDPNGCVEFTAGNYTGCSTGNNLTPPVLSCLMLPYTGSNPRFGAGGPAWVAGQNYTAGTLIQPTNAQHNGGGYLYLATNTGQAGPSSPNPWNQTVCTRQSDGTCSGGTQADGTVTWQNVGTVVLNKLSTGIFDPGLYYVAANGLSFGDGSTARVSTATGDGTNGVMFYFSTSATVAVNSNSGKSSPCTSASSGAGAPNGCIVSYRIDGAVSTAATGYVRSRQLQCPSGSANPSSVPTILDGNILLGPCSGSYASPDNNRGFLFFQNRSVSAQPSWGGGGQFLSSGFLYFHTGSGATCGTNTTCLTLKGGSGSQSYTLGNIVTDELAMSGNPQINMLLNPAANFFVLKARLLQ